MDQSEITANACKELGRTFSQGWFGKMGLESGAIFLNGLIASYSHRSLLNLLELWAICRSPSGKKVRKDEKMRGKERGRN